MTYTLTGPSALWHEGPERATSGAGSRPARSLACDAGRALPLSKRPRQFPGRAVGVEQECPLTLGRATPGWGLLTSRVDLHDQQRARDH